MMRFFVSLLTLLTVLTVGTDCFAAKVIAEDRAALGGITVGSKTEYVRSIYGAPERTRDVGDGRSIEWYYGDTFQIRFTDDRAVFVCSSGNNGLNMPDGVGVGMESKRVKKAFGRPREKFKFDRREVFVYDVAGAQQMMFVLNGKRIAEIRLTVKTE